MLWVSILDRITVPLLSIGRTTHKHAGVRGYFGSKSSVSHPNAANINWSRVSSALALYGTTRCANSLSEMVCSVGFSISDNAIATTFKNWYCLHLRYVPWEAFVIHSTVSHAARVFSRREDRSVRYHSISLRAKCSVAGVPFTVCRLVMASMSALREAAMASSTYEIKYQNVS